MKKVCAFLLSMFIVATLVACIQSNDSLATESNDSLAAESNTEVSANPTETINNIENSSQDVPQNNSDSTVDNTNETVNNNNDNSNSNGNVPDNTSNSFGNNSPTVSTQPESHTHNYTPNVIAPTCTTGGYTVYTCACGHSYNNNYTNPTNHSYSQTVTSATCTSQGYTTYTCACGHSYIGDQTQPSGHTYKEATCKQPKTCSVCNKTEGTTVSHIINANKVCKWCNQVVAVDPSNFNPNIAYTHLGTRYTGADFGFGGELQNVDCYVWTLLDFTGSAESQQQGVYSESDLPASSNGYVFPFQHNGKYYSSIAQASEFGYYTTYKIEGSEIIAHFTGMDEEEGSSTSNTIHFLVMSDGTLKVTAVYGYDLPEKAEIPVGSIFFPNNNPFPQRE